MFCHSLIKNVFMCIKVCTKLEIRLGKSEINSIFARYNLMNRWISFGKGDIKIKVYKLFVELYMTALLFSLYHKIPISQFWEYHYCVFPLFIILVFVEYVAQIKRTRSSQNPALKWLQEPSFSYSQHHLIITD